MTPIKLELGDRVRLTELGVSRSPKIRARTGVVVGLSKHYSGSASITVLFDGNIRPEPPRDCRRPFGLSYAAMAGCSSMA